MPNSSIEKYNIGLILPNDDNAAAAPSITPTVLYRLIQFNSSLVHTVVDEFDGQQGGYLTCLAD